MRQDLDGPFAEVDELVAELQRTQADIDEWRAHSEALAKLTARGLLASATDLIDRKVTADQVLPALEKAILEAHVDHVMDTDHRVSLYRSADRDHLVREYQSLDRLLLQSASTTVINALNNRRPRTATGVAGVIQREAQKKTRHMPVRKLLAETAAVTQRLKPCFMMSPLTVSQFLTSDISFDAVIFDEASQVLPADAVNCIYRGKQVIVAGDQKQALVSFSWVGFLTRIGRHTVPCRVSGCRGQDHRDRERCARIQGMAEGPSCRTDDG